MSGARAHTLPQTRQKSSKEMRAECIGGTMGIGLSDGQAPRLSALQIESKHELGKVFFSRRRAPNCILLHGRISSVHAGEREWRHTLHAALHRARTLGGYL